MMMQDKPEILELLRINSVVENGEHSLSPSRSIRFQKCKIFAIYTIDTPLKRVVIN